MNQLPKLYDNLLIFHTSARSCHNERDMVAAELLCQMSEYTKEQIDKVKIGSRAGGKAVKHHWFRVYFKSGKTKLYHVGSPANAAILAQAEAIENGLDTEIVKVFDIDAIKWFTITPLKAVQS